MSLGGGGAVAACKLERVYNLLSAEHGLSNIALRRMRISRLSQLNDPFEFLPVTTQYGVMRKLLHETKNTLHNEFGLLCFCRDWHNPVLWGHYASQHRGVCLGFDVPKPLLGTVKYRKEGVPIRWKDRPNKVPLLDDQFAKDLILTKFVSWKYEREVRVYAALDPATCEDGSYFKEFGNDLQLKEIILGPLCALPIETVRSLVRSLYGGEVEVFRAGLAFKHYAVVRDDRREEEIAKWRTLID